MVERCTEMKRGIDHLVLGVRDLDRARETYARMGFTTTPRAAHPFGTGNSLVQLQGNFLELLTVVDESKFAQPTTGQFEFGTFNKTYLDAREGMSMLVFEGHDAARDHADFTENGLDTYEPFHFERKATLPNGAEVTVAFSLVFVTDERMPDAVFFTCQQHAPEYFWKPEYQRHDNGALVISEVVMVAETPVTLTGLIGGMQSTDAVTVVNGSLWVATTRGYVTVMTPGDFEERFGLAPTGPQTPHFGAFQIQVTNLDKTEALLTYNDIAFRRTNAALQVGPETAFGCVLEFVAEG